MRTFDAAGVRCFVGDVEVKGFVDAPFDNASWDDDHRPTMCRWCRMHPRPDNFERCWRCGHVDGERPTGGTARPWEPAPSGFTWLQLALAFSPFSIPGYLID